MNPRRLQGSETLYGDPALAERSVLDFWRWAYGDLCPNNARGVFAEWLVAQLLDLSTDTARDPWAPADLVTLDGVKIEVKCGAYFQSWHGPDSRASRIAWSGLTGRLWDETANTYVGDRDYNSDLYVFCLQTMKDPELWNALDLSQWRFYLLAREKLAGRGSRSLTESRLQRVTSPLTAAEFREAARAAIAGVVRAQSPDEPLR